jgi:hypothetical protein
VRTTASPSSLSTTASSSIGIGAVENGRALDPIRASSEPSGPKTRPAYADSSRAVTEALTARS